MTGIEFSFTKIAQQTANSTKKLEFSVCMSKSQT